MSQKSFETVFMDRWDKDEPLSKWWESKNVEKKSKWSQAYSLINFTDDLMYDDE